MAEIVSVPDEIVKKIEELAGSLKGKEAIKWALYEFIRIYPIFIEEYAKKIKKQTKKTRAVPKHIDREFTLQGIRFKVRVTPSSKKDKIVVILYRNNQKLFVAGELVLKDDKYDFYPYMNKLEPWYKKTSLVPLELLIEKIREVVLSDDVLEVVNRWVEKGVRVRTYEEVLATKTLFEEQKNGKRKSTEESTKKGKTEDIVIKALEAQEELLRTLNYPKEIRSDDENVQKILKKYGFHDLSELLNVLSIVQSQGVEVRLLTEYYEAEPGVLKKIE